MKLKDYFNLDFEIYLDPWLSKMDTFNHGWIINYGENDMENDLLYLNSPTYNVYINKYFFSIYEKAFSQKNIAHIISPKLMFYEDNDGIKRLRISGLYFLKHLLKLLQYSEYRDPAIVLDMICKDDTIDNYIKVLRLAYVDEINKYEEVLKIGNKSNYFNAIVDECYVYGNGNPPEIFIKSKINRLLESIKSFDILQYLFKVDLNIDEFVNCFDYDKLVMIIAKSFIDHLDSINNIDHSYIYLLHYFDAIEKIRQENPNYNCFIKYYKNNRIRTMNIDDLITKYNSIKKRVNKDDLTIVTVNKQFIDNNISNEKLYSINPRELKELIIMLKTKESIKEINSEDINDSLDKINLELSTIKDETLKLKLNQQMDKIQFLLDNKPIKIFRGINNFSKYYGYVYKSGYVVFDVLDKNINKSYGNAMYIMSYDKMQEYCKMSKTDLRECNHDDIQILYHSNNWKDKLLNIINELEENDVDYSDAVDIDINSITNLKELNIIKERISELNEENKELLKEKERKIKAFKQIDDELKLDANIYDKKELEQISEIINNNNYESFEKIYNSCKNKKERKASVRYYTKNRARDKDGNYTCELCHDKSIFFDSFDAHHMIPLNAGGIDNIYNTICLCPNCHRAFHKNHLTKYQIYMLFDVIRKHLVNENIEYLPLFEDMIRPLANDMDDYEKNKESIDNNFSLCWNYTRKLNK